MDRDGLKTTLQIAKYLPLLIVYTMMSDKLGLWQYMAAIVSIILFGFMWYLQGRNT